MQFLSAHQQAMTCDNSHDGCTEYGKSVNSTVHFIIICPLQTTFETVTFKCVSEGTQTTAEESTIIFLAFSASRLTI
jgi:hypothetical protein